MKPGPKPDPFRAKMREMHAEMSDRTFDTWWSAFRTIGDLWGRDALKAAILAATRPNGSVNVAKFKRAADMAVMRYVMEMEADEPEPDDDCDD